MMGLPTGTVTLVFTDVEAFCPYVGVATGVLASVVK